MAGPLISYDGTGPSTVAYDPDLIASGLERIGATTSQYFYGTYSGADIKVVAHMPYDKEGLRLNNKKKKDLERKITGYEEMIRSASQSTSETWSVR